MAKKYGKGNMPTTSKDGMRMKPAKMAMISDDWSENCLLPQNAINKEYPKPAYHLNGFPVEDLFTAVQDFQERDGAEMRKAFKLTKY